MQVFRDNRQVFRDYGLWTLGTFAVVEFLMAECSLKYSLYLPSTFPCFRIDRD